MFKNGEKLWAVVPAAGQGRRVGGAVPKQYLEVAGIPILAHSLNRLAAVQQVDAIFVGSSDSDRLLQRLAFPHGLQVPPYTRGQSRRATW